MNCSNKCRCPSEQSSILRISSFDKPGVWQQEIEGRIGKMEGVMSDNFQNLLQKLDDLRDTKERGQEREGVGRRAKKRRLSLRTRR